ncbi:hypothetical protein COT72_03345 [archaeon CG10_big_fil_rev_8_21_14_0_10_43_11]|nr:MAG: hypothetical protein COT72_03345 [archaeon CG10_big_fil_rev_8_21_14_0_10_43_11]
MKRKASFFIEGPIFTFLLPFVIIAALIMLYFLFFTDANKQLGRVADLGREIVGQQSECGTTDNSYMTCIGPNTDANPRSALWDGCPSTYPMRIPVKGCRSDDNAYCCAKTRYDNQCEFDGVSVCAPDACPADCGTLGRACDRRVGLGSEDTFDYVTGVGVESTHACVQGCLGCLGLSGDQRSTITCPVSYPFRVPQDQDGINLDTYCPQTRDGRDMFCCQN